MKTDSKQKWLEIGYDLFGDYGPDGLNIKLISEKAGLPRTNFYYHFADKDDLIEQLLYMHSRMSEDFNTVLKKQLQVFIPDMYKLSEPYVKGFKFHRQLFLNRSDPRFNLVYVSVNISSNPIVLPKIIEYYKLNVPYSVIESLWTTVTDTWYSRFDVNKFEAAYLCGLTEEIMKTVLDFAKTKLFVNSIE
ncbi:MAG TPA: TetR/AcrR family transcriptional regulator [Bacteroidetes bacterium]|nr:TetR/AcrR family transcriptional regulator [Bacteroidota bacterium]